MEGSDRADSVRWCDLESGDLCVGIVKLKRAHDKASTFIVISTSGVIDGPLVVMMNDGTKLEVLHDWTVMDCLLSFHSWERIGSLRSRSVNAERRFRWQS